MGPDMGIYMHTHIHANGLSLFSYSFNISIIHCVRKVRVRLLSNVHIFRGKNTVLHVIITITKLSNLIGYQLP